MRSAPPDSAINLPNMLPNPRIIAIEPSTLPTPSVKRFMMTDNCIPLVNPMNTAASTIARIGFTLKRAMRTINPATAINVNSNKLVSWLKPGMVPNASRIQSAKLNGAKALVEMGADLDDQWLVICKW